MTAKSGTDHVYRRLRLAGAIVAALVVAGVAALYALSEPPDAVKDTKGCSFATCGPLEFGDCNAVLDGPLLVYTRVPRRFLEDCSHWRSGSAFCRAAVKVRNWCSP
jgi:hypothetical protein